jgi:hypothetical protein
VDHFHNLVSRLAYVLAQHVSQTRPPGRLSFILSQISYILLVSVSTDRWPACNASSLCFPFAFLCPEFCTRVFLRSRLLLNEPDGRLADASEIILDEIGSHLHKYHQPAFLSCLLVYQTTLYRRSKKKVNGPHDMIQHALSSLDVYSPSIHHYSLRTHAEADSGRAAGGTSLYII